MPEVIRTRAPALEDVFESYINMVVTGLIVQNQHIPAPVLWAGLAKAMGRIVSRATKSDDLVTTLAEREKFVAIMEDAIRNGVPSLDATSVMPAGNLNIPLRG